MDQTSQQCISRAANVPPEILAFTFAVSMDPNDADVDNSSNQIVACSQVCKFWRKVSLNTPTLWTKIDLMHPPMRNILCSFCVFAYSHQGDGRQCVSYC